MPWRQSPLKYTKDFFIPESNPIPNNYGEGHMLKPKFVLKLNPIHTSYRVLKNKKTFAKVF